MIKGLMCILCVCGLVSSTVLLQEENNGDCHIETVVAQLGASLVDLRGDFQQVIIVFYLFSIGIKYNIWLVDFAF